MPAVPYPIFPGAFIEVTTEFELNNQQNISLFHFVYTGTAILPDGAQVARDLLAVLGGDDDFFDTYRNCISADASPIRVYAQWVHPLRYAYVTGTGTFAPGAPAGALPQNVAIAITKRGIVANRSGIGTLHMGAVPEAWVINGKVAVGFIDRYEALAEQLPLTQDTVLGVSFDPVLFNRTNPADSQIIAEAFYQPTSRIMRRRTVGLGS